MKTGFKYTMIRRVSKLLHKLRPHTNLIYWKLIPTLYNKLAYAKGGYYEYNSPLNVTERRYINPNQIQIITGREFPPWREWIDNLGSEKAGDWDQPTERPPINESAKSSQDIDIYHARRFTETKIHQGLVEKFIKGYNWKDTCLVKYAFEQLDSCERDTIWHNCESKEDILERCETVNSLYKSMKENGYIGSHELNQSGERFGSFLFSLRNEIQIDIGRDGEPRFVGGRHRLSLAKILGIDSVPVTVLVRHPLWMKQRDKAYKYGKNNHFDFVEW